VLDVESLCTPGAGRGVSASCLPSAGAVVAFGDCTSPSSSSTSMVPTSELFVVVSTNIADLGGRSLPSSLSWPGMRVSSPQSGACVVVWRYWMDPCETCQAPRCHSRSLSRRRTRRRVEVALLARSLRYGLCSCGGLRRAAVPGISRCPHGAARKDIQRCVRTKTYTQSTLD
jgi:hypothetical protein